MIIVTGASRGLGKAICDHYEASGTRVIRLTRNKIPIQDELYCDISSHESVKKAAHFVKLIGEPIDAVVNAAGIASMNLVVTTPAETISKILTTNLAGTIFVNKEFAPLLIRQKSGVIINFSTIAVPLALKGEAVYAASKAGVETFTRTFAREVSNFGVRINCIAPGPIATDLLSGISDKQISDIVNQQIMRKQFSQNNIIELVDLLLSSQAESITGQVINVGGV
jgi:3-oxoacyl-[acyl-carrier protein] reductase